MKILHVEDSDTYALIVKLALEKCGLTVERYRSVQEITSVAGCLVCLLDLELQVTGGVETVKAFRKRYPFIPVVVLSGHNDSRLVADITRLGVFAFFDKGKCDMSDKGVYTLVNAMRTAIEHQEESKELDAKAAMLSAISSLKFHSERLCQVVPREDH